MGSDFAKFHVDKTTQISIHAPRRGSDVLHLLLPLEIMVFQSTLPAGGATFVFLHAASMVINFNPRSPQGERLSSFYFFTCTFKFQSTLPAGGATEPIILIASGIPISIHAPRRGSDFQGLCLIDPTDDFNPRSPQGERPETVFLLLPLTIFQSTLPAGGATAHRDEPIQANNFNPRSPQGERQNAAIDANIVKTFQSTLPAGGATFEFGAASIAFIISIHAPRRGSDAALGAVGGIFAFQSTLPAGGATYI